MGGRHNEVVEMLKARSGDKWGLLECLEAGPQVFEVMDKDADGNEYVSDSYTINAYRLRCHGCGNVVTIKAADFRGKRVMLDCGCGKAHVGKEGKAVTMVASVRQETLERVETYAAKEKVNFSQAVHRLLLEGLNKLAS